MTSYLPNNRTGPIPVEDALCNWVDIIQDIKDDDEDDDSFIQIGAPNLAEQRRHGLLINPFSPLLHTQKRNDKLSCPPRKGKAQTNATILLLRRYSPETDYTVNVKATEEGRDGREGRTIFDMWAEFELRSKDDLTVSWVSGRETVEV